MQGRDKPLPLLRVLRALRDSFSALFTPERDHWVYFGRATRRDIAGQQCHYGKQEGNTKESDGIGRAHAKEQARQ